MNHRNTPEPESKLSPAQLIFGRSIQNFLHIKLHKTNILPQECWILDRVSREQALKHRVHLGMEKWSVNKITKRWDRTGIVVEDPGFNKYRVRVDGSRRVTDKNRQFLRLFKMAKSTSLSGPTLFTHIMNVTQPAPRAGHVPVGDPSVDPEAPEQVPNDHTPGHRCYPGYLDTR